MQEDKMLDLIRRYLAGDCSAEEKNIVEKWVAEDPTHREYFETIEEIWDVTPEHDLEIDFNEEWERMSKRLGLEKGEAVAAPEPQVSKSYSKTTADTPIKYLLKVAAVILIIAGPAYYFASTSSDSSTKVSQAKMAMQKIETAKGEHASMEFSDGSKIILNSMSTVRFPKVFDDGKREVYLEGEAFFQVVHNEDVPFVVHTNDVTIEDLGTKFNINAYKEDGSVEVVVSEGEVSVKQEKLAHNINTDKQSTGQSDKTPGKVFLTKGQRTFVAAGELPSKPENVSLKPYMAWVNGRMVFEGTPLSDVIKRLKRNYDLQFQVQDSSLLSQRLEASFKRETPKKVLGIIAFSLGIDYELHGDTVIFKSKNNGKTQ